MANAPVNRGRRRGRENRPPWRRWAPWLFGVAVLAAGAAVLIGIPHGIGLIVKPDTAEQWYRATVQEHLKKNGLYPVFSGREYGLGDAVNVGTRLTGFAGTVCFQNLPAITGRDRPLMPIQFAGDADVGIRALGLGLSGRVPVTVNIRFEDVEVATVRSTDDLLAGLNKKDCANFPQPAGQGAADGYLVVGEVWKATQVVEVTVGADVGVTIEALATAAGSQKKPSHIDQTGASTLRATFPKQVIAVAPAFIRTASNSIILGTEAKERPVEPPSVEWIRYDSDDVPLRSNLINWLTPR